MMPSNVAKKIKKFLNSYKYLGAKEGAKKIPEGYAPGFPGIVTVKQPKLRFYLESFTNRT